MKERTEKAEDSRPWRSALFYQAGLQPHRDIIGTQAVGIADLWVMLCLEQNWAAAQWGFSCFVKATSNFKVILKKTDRMLVSISEILAVRTNRCQWQHPTADTECRVSCPQIWYTVPLGEWSRPGRSARRPGPPRMDHAGGAASPRRLAMLGLGPGMRPRNMPICQSWVKSGLGVSGNDSTKGQLYLCRTSLPQSVGNKKKWVRPSLLIFFTMFITIK